MRLKHPSGPAMTLGVPASAKKVICKRGHHIDVRPNWKEQPIGPSLVGKEWR
jgi:hypothetical protein